MSENMYGDSSQRPESPLGEPVVTAKKKSESKGYLLREQDHKQATNCKRRKPSDSEITINEIKNNTAEYLHNKIRMLTDPYPNAYIKCKDGSKLYLTKSHYND